MRAILRAGLPSTVGFVAQDIYAITDMFWVSRLPEGESAVAAITFFNQLMIFFFSLNGLIGPGSVAIISRRYGEKAYDRAEKAIKETLLLKLGSGLLFTVLGSIFLSRAMTLFGAEADVVSLATSYGTIVVAALPIMFATFSIFTALRSIANPNLAMAIMLGSNVLNIILDPILMFGWFGLPALGIVGAAWASAISYTIGFTVGMFILCSPLANVRVRLWRGLPLTWSSMWALIRIGIPPWIGESLWSLTRLVIVPMVATYGTVVVAAYGVGLQALTIGIGITIGLGLGISSLIGNTVGARKARRAKQTADLSLITAVGLLTVVGGLIAIFARSLVDIFLDDPEALAAGAELLRILAIAMPAVGLLYMNHAIHMGVGHNIPVMIVSILLGWFLQAAPIVIVVTVIGAPVTAVWWILAISLWIAAIGFFVYYRGNRWLRKRV